MIGMRLVLGMRYEVASPKSQLPGGATSYLIPVSLVFPR